jgi:rhodanese-related sulfurtransferase
MKLLISFFLLLSTIPSIRDSEKYVCLPCGLDCDGQVYEAPGKCQHCQMELVKKSTVTFKSIEPGEICNYTATHSGVVLLDVRTKEEFEGTSEPNFGTLKHAINIPITDVQNRLSELQKFKNKEIIVFCSHSHRSPQVSYLLTQNGFENVKNMNGGMSVMTDTACKK